MLRHKCLDVLGVRRRHPFLASGTFSSAWRLELKTNKAPYASSQMPRRTRSTPAASVPRLWHFLASLVIGIKRRTKHHVLRHKCKLIPVAKVTGIFVVENFLIGCYIKTLA